MSQLFLAARQLRKSPGFMLLAVLTLGLGLGLNATIFSLIDEFFLKGLPFPGPDRIVRIYGESKERNLNQLPSSVPRFWHFRDGQTVFSSIAADFSGVSTSLTGLGEPVQINIAAVTANYLDVIGIHPILGRGFLPQEEFTKELLAAKALVAPSLGGESFGIVLVRAMACATPVVASDIPGYRDVMTPETAMAFPAGDEHALAESVVALLADERRRQAMGIAGRKLAQRLYAWDAIARRLLDIYTEVAA